MGAGLRKVFRQKPIQVLYFGLDAVGKTTLIYKLKLEDLKEIIPTRSFNMDKLTINEIQMLTWDIGTRDGSRTIYRHMAARVDAVVFVVDSAARDRLEEAVDDFFDHIVTAVEDRKVPVLVLANKQDEPGVMTPDEIKKAIFSKREITTKMEVFPTVALTLEGVDPALNWLTSELAVKLARDSYLPCMPPAISKAKDYPESIFRRSYRKVAGLFASSEEKKATKSASTT